MVPMTLTTRILSSASAAILGAMLIAQPAQAQSLGDHPAVPAPSLSSSTMQTVGLTDMTITYSSPAARDRDIWGGLVPYGEVWRAGANAPTSVTFSTDVMIDGATVPAGTYTLLIMPNEGNWTAMFNTDPAGRGAYAYDAANDVATVTVTPTEAPALERMRFTFDNTTNSMTHLTLSWAGMAGAIPIAVDTDALIAANTEATFDSLWRPQFNVARYMLENGGDMNEAGLIMRRSIAIESNWWNNWFMAKIQNGLGMNREARASVETAIELGAGNDTFTNFFLPDAEEALENWPRR
ncbi:MAG: hypothetical protein ACI81R_002111 [Bradymonadia bacterium]|jgi:hypothetical protein